MLRWVGAVSEIITVTGETPLLDTTNASVGRVIGFRELRELPAEHGDPDNQLTPPGMPADYSRSVSLLVIVHVRRAARSLHRFADHHLRPREILVVELQ